MIITLPIESHASKKPPPLLFLSAKIARMLGRRYSRFDQRRPVPSRRSYLSLAFLGDDESTKIILFYAERMRRISMLISILRQKAA